MGRSGFAQGIEDLPGFLVFFVGIFGPRKQKQRCFVFFGGIFLMFSPN